MSGAMEMAAIGNGDGTDYHDQRDHQPDIHRPQDTGCDIATCHVLPPQNKRTNLRHSDQATLLQFITAYSLMYVTVCGVLHTGG